MANQFSQLSQQLFVHHGSINVGILRAGDRALLIDCGSGEVRSTLDTLGVETVNTVLFTHHHRDQASGMRSLAAKDTRIGVPAKERPWFEAVETFWNDPERRWHLYDYHPHNLMLAESMPVTDIYAEGDSIQWGDAIISVIDTPGHTDGSVSYVVEVDGGCFTFCGDTIYDTGQIWDLYSLQKGEQTRDYHGFLGDRKRLTQSLNKLRQRKPDVLIPSHGEAMRDPAHAIDTLLQRLDQCYDKYVAISALRYYFPQLFSEFSERAGHMPIRDGKEVPEFLRHYGTTWLIISQNKEAFVMDCGSPGILKDIQGIKAKGEIADVTGLWVTHYHDDHVDAIPEFQEIFTCETYADAIVATVVENPRGFRIPCISPAVARIDRRTQDGDSWTWNEFKMTAYHFPGQTYYHGGLLVEGRGVRLFFAGDSFTMAGLDDYCSGNRNLLGEGVGYDRCLALIAELKPTHIFNCHVNCAFNFTDEEIRWMRANLIERERLYTELFPWDHANYGTDEHWVRPYPYEQDVTPGETVNLRVDFTNHSSRARMASCRPVLPESWKVEIPEQTVTIPPKCDGHITFSILIPLDVAETQAMESRRIVIPLEVTYDGRSLGQFREAIFVCDSMMSNKEYRLND
jgi:glyoxylase-like metal-dependent hydrolase (beta-lactamase superfamily II)